MSLTRRSNSRGFDDLARTDATGARLDVLGAAVDHRPDALDVRQPAPLAHIVSVRDVAAGHRALAADFASLRHFRNPPRNPRVGVELNSTGGGDYQVCGRESIDFSNYEEQKRAQVCKNRGVFFFCGRNRLSFFSISETKNDTLFGRLEREAQLKNRSSSGFWECEKQAAFFAIGYGVELLL